MDSKGFLGWPFNNTDKTDEKETMLGRTKEGAVRGSLLKSTDGDVIYSFRSVPYGKPPVGSLRQAPKQTLLSLPILIASKYLIG